MCGAGLEKGWHAPQLERGGEQLDSRVERLLGDQLTRLLGLQVGEHELTRLLGLLVGEHERLRGRSHAAEDNRRESVALARAGGGNRADFKFSF